MTYAIDWKPASPLGRRWKGYLRGRHRVTVIRIAERRYECVIFGRRRYYGPDMRTAAKQAVAYVNNCAPSRIP